MAKKITDNTPIQNFEDPWGGTYQSGANAGKEWGKSRAIVEQAIKGKIREIEQDIYDYEETGEYDETDLSNQIEIGTAGRNVNAPGGALSTSQNYDASKYIDVGGYDAIKYSRAVASFTTVNFGIAFYDENKTYQNGWYQKALSSSSGATDYTLTTIAVPEGAKYVRLSLMKASAGWSSPEIYGLNKIYNKTSKFIDIENEIQENADNIDNVEHEIYNYEKIGTEEVADLSSQITHANAGYNVLTSGSLSGGSSVNDATDFIYIGDYDAIKYSRNSKSSTSQIGIAFYKENKSTCVGGEEAITNSSATNYVLTEIAVPEGAKYVRMTIRKSTSWDAPVLKGMRNVYSKTSKLSGFASDIQLNTNNISALNKEIYEIVKTGVEETADLSSLISTPASYGKRVNKDGTLANSETNDVTGFVDIGNYDGIRYSRNSRTNNKLYWGIAFYASDQSTCVGYQLAIYNTSPTDYVITDIDVPENAKYVRMTTRRSNDNWSTPVLIGLTYSYAKISKIEEIEDKIENVGKGIYPPLAGFPQPYLFTPTEDVGVTLFNHVADLHAAYDALCSQYPRWLKREENIGTDATETYEVRHYTLRYQTPSVRDTRNNTGTNLWNDESFPMRRILLMTGIHALEKYSTLGTYLAVKAICESSEPWAQFIKANAIIDIIPIINPWGLENNSNYNVNNLNLNRDYDAEVPQVETQNVIDFVQSMIPLNLGGIVDMHNCGSSDNDTYIVTSTQYKEYKYYARLAQQLNVLMGSQLDTAFGTSNSNHLHAWTSKDSGVLQVGQGHWYADKVGILGITCEARTTSSIHYRSSCISAMMAVNSIIAFIQKIN